MCSKMLIILQLAVKCLITLLLQHQVLSILSGSEVYQKYDEYVHDFWTAALQYIKFDQIQS